MDPEFIFLASAPMPYLTDCDLKHFGAFEYHCSRYCDYFVLIFMLNNHLKFTENSQLTTLSAGEWYIQKKALWQSAPLPSPHAEYYWIHFKAEYSKQPLNRIKLPIRGTFQPSLFLPLLRELRSAFSSSPQNHFQIQSEFYRLLDLLYAHENAYSPLTAKVMSFLNEHYPEHITAQTLADQFHYSTEYINKRMKAELGVTAHAYLANIRLRRASRLLSYSEKPILELSHECGYSDVSLFYKAFRKAYGISPSQYRKERQVPFAPAGS
ncbi:MAG TPA: AraC family transcriptional regulator [Candidatus Eisenbergiella merdipullorum]|uniref:AraC family transcriptional regulator n=1 Tax=Candidatus Eisenbergiella merdipullorum TaxID=2838553 RepID=A0A9D2L0R0_9FIRM|nr:AraC family transcriptional regulator [Candidatus Eisenbergiella merdipullorum]